MRKSVYSALLTALSLVSLSPAAETAAPVAEAAAPAIGTATLAQAAPGVPAADTAQPKTLPPESVQKPDTASIAAPALIPDTSVSRSAGDSAAASARAADSAAAAALAPAAAGAAPDTAIGATAKPKKRKRVVRETTVNTIDELKGRYRSPKKALFMSLLVPGLGQAYVGQHWSNYARGAGYLMLDVGLLLGWNHYVNTKQDRQIRNYRRFADENWSLSRYEDSIAKHAGVGFSLRNDNRESYCESVQNRQGTQEQALYQACLDPGGAGKQTDYGTFQTLHSDKGLEADSVGELRAQFPNPVAFYELIGKHTEFVTGWKDAENIVIKDSALTDAEGNPATTDYRQEYIAMRSKANDYARMQAWFLGGIVLNHIVSALDAAFAANIHNKSLYQTEVGLLERLRFDSGLAWDGPLPRPSVTASLTF